MLHFQLSLQTEVFLCDEKLTPFVSVNLCPCNWFFPVSTSPRRNWLPLLLHRFDDDVIRRSPAASDVMAADDVRLRLMLFEFVAAGSSVMATLSYCVQFEVRTCLLDCDVTDGHLQRKTLCMTRRK